MAEAGQGKDQSMDEILASIRKIISSDAPAASKPAASPAPQANDVRIDGDISSHTPIERSAVPDDLSDILEPAVEPVPANAERAESLFAVHSEQPGIRGETAEQSWPFDDRGKNEPEPSLQAKLASLDSGRGGNESSAGAIGTPSDRRVADDGVTPVAQRSATALDRHVMPLSSSSGGAAAEAEQADPVVQPRVLTPVPEAVPSLSDELGKLEMSSATSDAGSRTGDAMSMSGALGVPVADAKDKAVGVPRHESASANDTVGLQNLISSSQEAVPVQMSVAPAEMKTVPTEISQTEPAPADAITGATSGSTEPATQVMGAKTLEDVVGETLRPLLREWLDANLPKVLEAQLKDEAFRAELLKSLK